MVQDLIRSGWIDDKDVRDAWMREVEDVTGYKIETVISSGDSESELFYDFIASSCGVARGKVRVRVTAQSVRLVVQTLQ